MAVLTPEQLKKIANQNFVPKETQAKFGVEKEADTPYSSSPETPTQEGVSQKPIETSSFSRIRPIKDETPNYAQSVEDIQGDMIRSAQGEIDSINRYAKDLLDEQRVINEKNDRSTAAVSTLTGLAGSTEANVAQQKTTAEGQKANQRIQNEAEVKIQTLLGNIRRSAFEEARAQRQEARLDEAQRIANRAARQQEAVTQLTNIAASGITFEGLKAGDPDSFQYLAEQFGGEAALKGAFVLNTPVDQILDKRVEGGKYIISKQNPLTGKVTIETLDLGLPNGYTKTIDAGDRILAIPENWSGDPSELITIEKGLSPQSSGADPNQIIDNERALFSQFRNEPIVKTYNEVLNKKLSVDAIIEQGVGGPADLALVFEFMKALDPSSVVREAEYESAAKSGNIFAGTFARFNGYLKPKGGFLPDNVKEEFQNMVNIKLAASQQQYDNLSSEYAAVAQRQGLNPMNVVVNYAGAAGNGQAPVSLEEYYNQSPGNQRKVDALIQENPGLTDDELMQILGFNSVGGDTQQASRIAAAIREVESGGNYRAKGASGEFGAYQFMPATWRQWAGEYLGDPNAPQTRANQDLVAEKKIASLLAQGHSPREIALIWNGGEAKVKKGVNRYGVKYDSGAYANKVLNKLYL